MKITFFFVIFLSLSSSAQSFRSNGFGGSIGVFYNMGTHQRSIGVNAKAFYTNYFFQFNIGSSVVFHNLSYANRRNFIENRSAVGLVLLAGKKNATLDFDLDGLNHQTNYNLGLAFNYLFYLDNAGTSQLSGAWGLHFKNVSFKFENDIFGGFALDKYRSGIITLSYKTKMIKYNLGLYVWTGETEGMPTIKVDIPGCPNGYRNLESSKFGKTSHGIMYGGIQVNMPYGNVGYVRLGADSEHIRQVFQNRFIHDQLYLPTKMRKHFTPHYPRLDENGCGTFNPKLVRKDKLYFQFGLNDNWGN